MNQLSYLLCSLLIFSSNSFANETKENKPANSQLRCEKFREPDRKVSTLKEKLEENCDTTKPFTTSLSVFAGEETYLYCCNLKK
ncbi:MAG: hypothetical protein ACK5W9_09205 [Bdellovibrionales bacterium]